MRYAQIIAATVLSDPLSDRTRRSRALLLSIGVLTVLVIHFGVSTSAATLVGIRFEKFDPQVFKQVLSLVLLFIFIEFVSGAATDLLVTFHKLAASAEQEGAQMNVKSADALAREARAYTAYYWLRRYATLTYIVALARLLFEVVVPTALSVYAFTLS